MKLLLTSLISLFVFFHPLIAQKDFEGIITYKIELTGENARQMAAFMPSSYEYKFKGNLIRFSMEGGVTASLLGEFLIDTKKGDAWMLKPDEETAYRITGSEPQSEKPSVTATHETLNIQGYRCKKYKVSTPTEQGKIVQYVWTTPDIGIAASSGKRKRLPADIQQLLIEGLEGFPLKIMTTVPEGGFIMVLTASNIDVQRLDKASFTVPRNYTIKDFDAGMFGGY